MYQRFADQAGLRLRVPGEAARSPVDEAIAAVKASRSALAGELLRAAVSTFDDDGVALVAACTELPLAHAAARLPPERMVSSRR